MIRTDDPLYNFHIWFQEKKESQSIDWDSALLKFNEALWDFYKKNKRTFLWRDTLDTYLVVVSEIMLQQTQTQRVALKIPSFLKKFPTFSSLAQATSQELLQQWIGLGYNRRAFCLQGIARKIILEHEGLLPDNPVVLETFKGIGPATAASITAFAYNKPVVFIETNIRAVFLHTFFHNKEDVSDKILLPLIEAALDKNNPRQWYYALMDYGVCIKKLYPNPSRKSKHYNKQSQFEGSDRQVRGAIIKLLSVESELSKIKICKMFSHKKDKIESILEQLCIEKMICKKGLKYKLN